MPNCASPRARTPPGSHPAWSWPSFRPWIGAAASHRRALLSAARVATRRAVIEDGERPFWATVNICDTDGLAERPGRPGEMPGNGSDERIWARYTAQWWSGAAQEWKTVGGSGVTDWVYVGSADMSARQAGWTFRFVQPPAGATFMMRGVVEFEWRDEVQCTAAQRSRRARRAQRVAVVRQRTLLTETGMQGVHGGIPPGRPRPCASSGSCAARRGEASR